MVISAMPPGAVEMIMVAMGRPKAQASTPATATEAIRMKNELSRAKGIKSL